MLRLSRLADYGVMVMAHVAAEPAAVHNATDAASATGLPGPTVAKIMAKLARAGLLTSQRGAKGGYRLAAPPEEISVAAIITALDGPIALTQCSGTHAPSACNHENLCVSRRGINRINTAIRSALEGVMLAELARPYDFITGFPPRADVSVSSA
ncbi:MAG TPA: SUF system Fe-S cluster assembly regulator [Ferrovibrio sp.]|uniref:SUF system Fe-S cluster assembly regulator n=1 Tax=Ferrovibrio sp. TaxID=1917215 RepID=UPI002B4AAEBC|nr:SUF system Fe-S cluster assembly regulator [Ferrovibrio sp.]HLT78100.1 SUF system Fe-S cluster assembly regulator [Ferrovibrio sp.]